MPNVILVDQSDKKQGIMEKTEAHKKGLLHRCFSIFIFNTNGEMLIHQRALEKYHCGGLWTNACCSHPEPNESNQVAAHRRLKEEMGFDIPLSPLLSFIYKAHFENGLTEHEYDYVFIGEFNKKNDFPINPNPKEVLNYKWIKVNDLLRDIEKNPKNYTVWFRIIIKEVLVLREKKEQNIPHLGQLTL